MSDDSDPPANDPTSGEDNSEESVDTEPEGEQGDEKTPELAGDESDGVQRDEAEPEPVREKSKGGQGDETKSDVEGDGAEVEREDKMAPDVEGDGAEGEPAVSNESEDDGADASDLTREGELEERERTLDERERGLQQIRAELDERQRELEEHEAQLEGKRDELRTRKAELEEWEENLEARASALDDREGAIETQEEALAERAAELDEHEAILDQYVDDRVGEALDGRIDRIEKIVGERIVALEEEVAGTIETEISASMRDQEEPSQVGLVGGVALGLLGVTLVALGVVFALATEVAGIPALHSDFTVNVAGAGVFVILGILTTMIAVSGRL